MSVDAWESVRSGRSSNIYIDTGSATGRLEAVEIVSGMHDDKLEDVDKYKSRALEYLARDLFVKGRDFSEWLHVFLAALSDPAFPTSGKWYALGAASKVKSPEVVSVLKALIPNQELGWVRKYLPGAFYRQGESSSINMLTSDANEEVASKAKFLEAALSWESVGQYCPHLDDHGVCLHGAGTDDCPMIFALYPYDSSRKVSTGKRIVLPDDRNYTYCPRYQSGSPFH